MECLILPRKSPILLSILTPRANDSLSLRNSSIHSKKPDRSDPDSDDDAALLEELEDDLDNDFELGGFREKRMMELKAQCDTFPSTSQVEALTYSCTD